MLHLIGYTVIILTHSLGYHPAFIPKTAIDEICVDEKKVSHLFYVCPKNPLDIEPAIISLE